MFRLPSNKPKLAPPPLPKGRAVLWTAYDIMVMTTFTPEDIAKAKRWWRNNAPPRYEKVLDAKCPAGLVLEAEDF